MVFKLSYLILLVGHQNKKDFTMRGILQAKRNKHIWKLTFLLDAKTTIRKIAWKERRPINQGSCREKTKLKDQIQASLLHKLYVKIYPHAE